MNMIIRFPGVDRVVLASRSPRRIEILKDYFPELDIIPADVSETRLKGESPEEMAERLSILKAETVWKHNRSATVVAADTVVALGDRVFGKPGTASEAAEMLRVLSGQTHQVVTGVGLRMPDGGFSFCETTNVTFHPVKDAWLDWYVYSGEPMDKAGAYGIQGKGALLVKSIGGDYLNVVGFPLSRFLRCLLEKGYISFHQ